MDAISALGVAAATVQFLDFSLQALHLCRQIRDDVIGATAVNTQLDEYAREIRNAARELKTASLNSTSTARQIAKVAQQCVATADELIGVLEKVQRAGQSSFLNDVKATFRVMKDRRTIEKLQNALKTHQQRLDSAVTHDVRNRIDLAGITQSRQFESLEKRMQQLALSSDQQQLILQEQQLTRLRHHSLLQTRFAAAEQRTADIGANLATNHQATMHQLAGLSDNLNSGFGQITAKDAQAKFLGGLFFPELRLRQETFSAPAGRTCEWIFQTSSSYRLADFSTWLRSGTGMFWISGKAGSGKSTLMAHLVGHPKTISSLQEWSTPQPLHLLTFFFWRSGNDLQKTVLGMLRSLLYQLVECIPDLLLSILMRHPLPPDRYPAWSEPKLVDLIKFALAQAAEAHRICIFIDGLDEHVGNSSDLLQVLRTLLVSENVKACVSSRPDPQLARDLSESPHTRMEVCNRADIEHYVFERFATLQGYRSFAQTIVEEAQGVFLWAALVTRSIIVGIESGDDESLLKSRLEDHPAEMTALIGHMASRISFIYTSTLGAYFSILRCHRMGIGDEPTLALITASSMSSEIVSYKAFKAECNRTKVRISAQSGGLLEVKDEEWYSDRSASHVWSLSSALRSADAHGTSNITRRALAANRSLADVDELVFALQTSEATTVAWLHRSVHDLFFDADTNALSTKLKFQPMSETVMMLLKARMKLLVSAPSNQSPLLTAPTRVVDIVGTAIRARSLIGDNLKHILDELADVIGHFPREELEFRGMQRSLLGDLILCSTTVSSEAYARAILYLVCIDHGELSYVRTGIDLMFRGVNSCWIVARLVYRCCSARAAKVFVNHSGSHTLAESSSDDNKHDGFLLFLLRALKARGPAKQRDSLEQRISWRLWRVTIRTWLHVSFENLMPIDSASLECEILPSLAASFLQWRLSLGDPGTGQQTTALADWTPGAVECLAHFEYFMDLWDVHTGVYDDIQPGKAPPCMLQSSWSATHASRDGCPQCEAADANCSCTRSSEQPDRRYRIVCQRLLRVDHPSGLHRSLSTWNDGKHIMLYNFSSPVVEVLGQLSTSGKLGGSARAVIWNRSSVLWDALIADVKADIGGQLDSWQQLFALACLRAARRNGHMA